ncbi:DNA polymerase beta [Prochlorothrix hollandica PCC 9006 = CALU 1027]|uniref:DNA polymerase beta n=1 Tax=Prochlorothrix hollandica PCC 9006 = CALU 1027 TaxID=317619 RepID=A0A0M2PWD6_PROHO|nr:DNA polymerase beta [Prochlorothrix hollandica PCC 9006 = CALU 1027]
MKSLEEIRATLQEHRETLHQTFQVTNLWIFGSYGRGEQQAHSDLDVLIDYDAAPTFWTIGELREYLQDLLDIKVDVVTRDGLKPNIRARVLAEAILL